MADEPVLIYDQVSIAYQGRRVVHEVSACLHMGEVLCIVGESGSGKSTLIKAGMGLLDLSGMVVGGDIVYQGQHLLQLPPARLRALCGVELGMIFQDCLAALSPIRRIGDQWHETLRAHNISGVQEADRRLVELLERMNMHEPNRVLESYPFELSGGMGQRVGIAMALALQPQVIFADEPTSALDTISQKQVMDELRAIKQSRSCALILVTHNIALARYLGDQVMVLKEGRVVEQGLAQQVLKRPAHAYTQELLNAVLTVDRGEQR